MFMRGLCVASLLIVACFDGGSAPGYPCNADAECGKDKCMDGFCGGPPATSGTTPSTSDTQETLTVGATDTTTDGPTSTTLSTTMDTSGSGDESSTTGDPNVCAPPPNPGVCARDAGIIESPSPISIEFPSAGLGRAISVTAGDYFNADGVPDLAILRLDSLSMVLVENENAGGSIDEWDVTDAVLDSVTFQALNAYDVVSGDFACDGGTVFAFAGQAAAFGFLGWSEGFGSLIVLEKDTPGTSFSITVADVVPDDRNLPDAVIAGNSHVTVFPNIDMFFDEFSKVSLVDDSAFAEPWDVHVIGSGSDARILVPTGEETDIEAPGDQPVSSLRVQPDEVEYANPAAIADDFRNPWAIASGDFNDDGVLDVAIAERNVDAPMEGANAPGNVRFYSVTEADSFQLITTIPIGVGPNSIAAADFDCDGIMDLVLGNGGGSVPERTGGQPQIIFGRADLENAAAVDVPGITDISPSSRIAIGDFDGDGRPEAAIGDYGLEDSAGNRFIVVDVE